MNSETLDDANLLFEIVGSEVSSPPMVRFDIHLMRIVHDLEEYIINIKRGLFPHDILRKMSVMAVVKILAIILGYEDRW